MATRTREGERDEERTREAGGWVEAWLEWLALSGLGPAFSPVPDRARPAVRRPGAARRGRHGGGRA